MIDRDSAYYRANPVREIYEEFAKAAGNDGIPDNEDTQMVFIAGFINGVNVLNDYIMEQVFEPLRTELLERGSLAMLAASALTLPQDDPRLASLTRAHEDRFHTGARVARGRQTNA